VLRHTHAAQDGSSVCLGFQPCAARVADTIKEATGESSELISGHKGEFTIWVEDAQVADKIDGEFSEDADCINAVSAAL
jgi:hypothetical protein